MRGVAQHRPHVARLRAGVCAQHQSPVGGRVAGVAGVARVVVAGVRRRAPGRLRIHHMRTHEHDRRVQHRHINVLAAAAGGALKQRRGDGECGLDSAAVVQHRRADFHRRGGGVAGRCHQAGIRLNYIVVSGARGMRAVLAEAGQRAINQVRAQRFDRGVAEAERVQCAAAVVLHQHIGGGDEAAHDGRAGG